MTPLLLALLLLSFPYIALAPSVQIGTFYLDTPLADLAAAALLPFALVGWLRRPIPLPGARGYGALLLVGVVALATVPDPGASAWFLLRKPLFLYVAYGIGLSWWVARGVSAAVLRALLLASVALVSIVSLSSSFLRIARGDTLWFTAIAELTNNHKTLAVALAPLVPLVLALRRGRLYIVVSAFAISAITLSFSRTAWIALAAGLAFVIGWRGRALATRRGLVLALVVVGIVGALYGPLLTRSATQLDAARSRHSLNKRALAMVSGWPALGMGGGANVRFEQQIFPDYRVNGVDAHGVIQKVGSEYGLLGLAAYGAFVGGMALRIRRRAALLAGWDGWLAPANATRGAWATFVALHVNLLLSTETFSQTHWVPLALAWGLSWRRGPGAGGGP